MLKKIGIGFAVLLFAFLAFVSSRPGHFNYERSGVIKAPAEKIFPYLVDFRKGSEWNPYEKMDPAMKKTYSGTGGEIGSSLVFVGNSDVGSGRLELMKVEINKSAEIKLTMTEPMKGENHIIYTLTPEPDGTRFSWSMSGDGGFVMKLMSVFIDCEKMIAGQFTEGIANLKTIVESQQATAVTE